MENITVDFVIALSGGSDSNDLTRNDSNLIFPRTDIVLVSNLSNIVEILFCFFSVLANQKDILKIIRGFQVCNQLEKFSTNTRKHTDKHYILLQVNFHFKKWKILTEKRRYLQRKGAHKHTETYLIYFEDHRCLSQSSEENKCEHMIKMAPCESF